jgi:hypothetical protein
MADLWRWFDENPDRSWWLVCFAIIGTLVLLLRPAAWQESKVFAIITDQPMAPPFVAAHLPLNTLSHAYTPVAKVGTLTIDDLALLKPRKQ